jgi:hypothetical protein
VNEVKLWEVNKVKIREVNKVKRREMNKVKRWEVNEVKLWDVNKVESDGKLSRRKTLGRVLTAFYRNFDINSGKPAYDRLNVEFGHQLSFCSRAQESHRKP